MPGRPLAGPAASGAASLGQVLLERVERVGPPGIEEAECARLPQRICMASSARICAACSRFGADSNCRPMTYSTLDVQVFSDMPSNDVRLADCVAAGAPPPTSAERIAELSTFSLPAAGLVWEDPPETSTQPTCTYWDNGLRRTDWVWSCSVDSPLSDQDTERLATLAGSV